MDIAKEAADIILLEKSLLVLDQGVIEGRTTFCNMLKYIRMTASSNFGNVLSVLVATPGAIALVAVWQPMGPLAPYFKLQALPLAYFGWLAATLAGYFGLRTLMKRWYVRRFGWQ